MDQYADAVHSVLPDDLSDVALVGYSFGGFTATRVAIEHPDLPVVYFAAWIPQPGVSVMDLFADGDPFEGQDEEVELAAFGGLIVTAGPGLCALNVETYVAGWSHQCKMLHAGNSSGHASAGHRRAAREVAWRSRHRRPSRLHLDHR